MCASAMRAAEPDGTSICTKSPVGGIEEPSGVDEERRAAVPHLVELPSVRKLADRQEALGEHRVRVRDVVVPRLDEGNHLTEPIFGGHALLSSLCTTQ